MRKHFFTKLRRIFITSAPVSFIIRKSKKIILPGFNGIPLFDVVSFFYQQTLKASLNERAAAIAFNLFMAIPPACIFFFTLVPFLPIKGFMEELYQLIKSVIPGKEDNAAIISFLDDFTTRQRNDLLSFGFLLAVYFTSNAVIAIMRSFNKDILGFRKRTYFQLRGSALKLTFIICFVFIFSIVALVSRGTVLDWLGVDHPVLRTIIFNARWLVILMLFFFTISFIYRYAPAVHKKWKLVNPGSILATFLMILFTMLFSYWVVNFNSYNKLYGSISTILILMLLIYFNSLVLLIGFELNAGITSLKRVADERNKILAEGKHSH